MKNNLVVLIVFCFQFVVYAQTTNDNFIRGVDISFTPQIEDLGGKYKENGVVKDILDILSSNGVNYIRLRNWNNPKDGYSGLQKTLPFAKRLKEKGFKFLLDFHYSDWWADPGKQNKPAAWASLSFTQLKDSVYAYTKYVITALKNQNSLPDMVQIGNEITPGMLWPDGRNNTAAGWVNLGELLKKGIQGVKDAAGSTPVKIMLHIDRGGDYSTSKWWFDNILAQNVEFDVIGLSYYPWWHGTFEQLKNNLTNLALLYKKEIVVAETAYPNNNIALNDGMQNVSYDANKLIKGYTVSVGGQKDFLVSLIKIIKDTPSGKGVGLFYWEPAYISVPPIGSSWEYYTLFSPTTGEALSSLSAFKSQENLKSIKVNIRLNTSTNSDTLKSNGVVVIVGQINGIGTNFLPSGERITWDNSSGLVLKNVDGDNWEYQFQMYPDDQMEFKFWTGHTKANPTKPRLGWEGPVIPFNSQNKNARLFNAGFEDTTLILQYYNSSNDNYNQYYSPLVHKNDSVAVMFRVNISALKKKGIFNFEKNYITLRGDNAASAGILSWNSNKIKLKCEDYIYTDSSFYSGVIYFPKNKISAGVKIKYKFFVENSNFGGWESGINDRLFYFPIEDTTLVWKFFNDKLLLTDVERENQLPSEFKLYQNYPNPFNPETVISYQLPISGFVTLKIYDLLGREIEILVNEFQPSGKYNSQFSTLNSKLTSGVYFYKLQAGNFSSVKKMVLIR
jgi:arabinogalactan endo-1,4-beta-galactosidase